MKVLLTGAHFTTAVAVIKKLKSDNRVNIVYVGRKFTQEGDKKISAESQIIPTLGVKFISLTTGRLQRNFSKYTITSLLKIPIGFIQALAIIFKEKPDILVSFGGYISVPLVIISWFFRIPILVHEQTLVAGLANRISAFFATRIAISFDNSHYDSDKTILTGNPIRDEILLPSQSVVDKSIGVFFDKAKKANKKVVFITCGNQGSHVINLVIEKLLGKINENYYILHQTGDSKYEDYQRLEKVGAKNYLLKKFIFEDIGYVLKRADIIISRGGINTLTELAYLGKPTIIIPFPGLFGNEQEVNAHYFEKFKLGKVILQNELEPDKLMEVLDQMSHNLKTIKNNAIQARSLVVNDALDKIIKQIYKLTK